MMEKNMDKPAGNNQVLAQQNVMASTDPTLGVSNKPSRLRSRKLGLLETMYHTYNSRHVDVSPLLFKFSCRKPVSYPHIERALRSIADEFPALRLTIQQTGPFEYKFVEKKDMPIRICEVVASSMENMLNLETMHTFDFENGPLWKFSWVKSTSENFSSSFHHMFQFIFTFHHAICDFHQGRSIVRRLLKNIASMQDEIPPFLKTRRLLSPPIDQVVPLHLVPKSSTKNKLNKLEIKDAIAAYNTAFGAEISCLSMETSLGSSFVSLMFSETDTQTILKLCKLHEVKLTSAITAATALSFLKLVRRAVKSDSLEIPFEIMVDMTRYIMDNGLRKNFSSVGAIHVPLIVKTNVCDLDQKDHFWFLAKQCQSNLDDILATGLPMAVLERDLQDEICKPPPATKSPYVLSISNMGPLDIVPDSCASSFKLESFNPWTNLSAPDMPLFCTGVHTLNNSLVLSNGYDSSYTSKQTSVEFISNISRLLNFHGSKL